MRGAHGFLQKAKPSRHNQVVRSGRRQRSYLVIKYTIVGDNGIIEGPMNKEEANERLLELVEEFPDTKFEVKEVK